MIPVTTAARLSPSSRATVHSARPVGSAGRPSRSWYTCPTNAWLTVLGRVRSSSNSRRRRIQPRRPWGSGLRGEPDREFLGCSIFQSPMRVKRPGGPQVKVLQPTSARAQTATTGGVTSQTCCLIVGRPCHPGGNMVGGGSGFASRTGPRRATDSGECEFRSLHPRTENRPPWVVSRSAGGDTTDGIVHEEPGSFIVSRCEKDFALSPTTMVAQPYPPDNFTWPCMRTGAAGPGLAVAGDTGCAVAGGLKCWRYWVTLRGAFLWR